MVKICTLECLKVVQPRASALELLLTLKTFNSDISSARTVYIIVRDLYRFIVLLRPLLS
jgi:hypothetical protein